ncbi:LINE-1 retrotransposable element ORF1 protein [Labeo rohita]|uniref:LINE-1 retrotransposable element ORF1 protein n=1 Tax=Labeo rohita TaxID=84645 RepID=A0ABQ8LK67_LABRO|nr:LINE-1 retrotransposable element ORF1 protein [Labeo rohita]
METREKSRKTNTDALEIEGRQQGGAGAAHALAHDANCANPDSAQINLERILEEIQNFRKENNRQLDEIKIELNKTNQRISHAEDQLHVERAHRALVPKPGKNARPRSIVVKFLRYKMKEEVIRKAWEKKDIFVGQQKIYFDHDYPPAVLQKRKEYSEVKKALKDRKIRFQTPYLARLHVFYEDGTHIYHTAEDAFLDMVKRGFHVEKTLLTESLMEQLEHTSWETTAQQKTRAKKTQRSTDVRDRLQAYRR